MGVLPGQLHLSQRRYQILHWGRLRVEAAAPLRHPVAAVARSQSPSSPCCRHWVSGQSPPRQCRTVSSWSLSLAAGHMRKMEWAQLVACPSQRRRARLVRCDPARHPSHRRLSATSQPAVMWLLPCGRSHALFALRLWRPWRLPRASRQAINSENLS